MFPTLTGATVPYPSCASHTKIDRTDRHREMKKKIGRDKEPESTKPPHTPQATKTTQTRDDDEITIQSYSMLKDRVRERSRETESPRKTQQKIEKETQREKARKAKSTENTKQIYRLIQPTGITCSRKLYTRCLQATPLRPPPGCPAAQI